MKTGLLLFISFFLLSCSVKNEVKRQLSYFQIDSTGNLWILNRGEKSVYEYTPYKGFQEKISFPYWVDNIKLFNADTMMLYMGNKTDGNNTDQIKLLRISQQRMIITHSQYNKKNTIWELGKNKFI
jgi:hypothetical protein